MSGWVDSHCHLQGAVAATADRPERGPERGDVEAVLARAREAGVEWMVCVGTDLATSREALRLARAHPGLHATVGLHPHDASRLDDEWGALEELAATPGVVGVGEAGLDFHYDLSPRADQEEAFRRQVRLAHRLALPLVVHSREAWDETFGVLGEEGAPERLVFHCFTGGPQEARRALALGARVSFSGIVSFRNADDVRAAAALVPPGWALVETDSPYLAPVPHRGRPNEPAYLPDVGAALAAATGQDVAEVRESTAAAAAELFLGA